MAARAVATAQSVASVAESALSTAADEAAALGRVAETAADSARSQFHAGPFRHAGGAALSSEGAVQKVLAEAGLKAGDSDVHGLGEVTTAEAFHAALPPGEAVWLTFSNAAYLHFAQNWYMSVRAIGRGRQVVVAALDAPTLKAWRELKVPVLDYTEFGDSSDFRGIGSDQARFRRMGAMKVAAFNQLLKLNRTVLVSDVDTVWTADPQPYLASLPGVVDLGVTSDCLSREADENKVCSLSHSSSGQHAFVSSNRPCVPRAAGRLEQALPPGGRVVLRAQPRQYLWRDLQHRGALPPPNAQLGRVHRQVAREAYGSNGGLAYGGPARLQHARNGWLLPDCRRRRRYRRLRRTGRVEDHQPDAAARTPVLLRPHLFRAAERAARAVPQRPCHLHRGRGPWQVMAAAGGGAVEPAPEGLLRYGAVSHHPPANDPNAVPARTHRAVRAVSEAACRRRRARSHVPRLVGSKGRGVGPVRQGDGAVQGQEWRPRRDDR